MSAQGELLRILGAQLAPLGFRRRAGNWYRIGLELYIVINIQRSSWGDALYVNIGAAPIECTTDGWLPVSKCLVRFRADALNNVSTDIRTELRENVFEDIDVIHWKSKVTETLARPIATALADVSDLPSLGELLRKRVGNQVMIHRKIRGSLDL